MRYVLGAVGCAWQAGHRVMRRGAWCTLVTICASAVPLGAQSASVARLEPADARLAEPFTNIHSVRELSDGRVLISDASENRLVVADVRTGAVRQIGRNGAGPGEYRQAGRLLALSHDSTLFIDGARGPRWLLMVGDSIVATLPPDLPALFAAVFPVGADVDGHVLGVRTVQVERLGPDRTRVHQGVILAHRDRATADTLFRLRGSERHITQTRRPDGQTFWIEAVLVYSVREQALLFPDGWIAVARIEPYRVEWRSPDGRLTRGPVLPWTPVRVDDRERRLHLADLQQRNRGARLPTLYFAPTVPPIADGALLAMPDGTLALRKSKWSRAPETRYDFVDRRGELIGHLVLPANERIVGSGRRSLYLAVTDQDGLQTLRRHPWP